MVMYGIFNLNTLETLINAVHKMHNKQLGMKNCLRVNLIIGITGIYPRMELAIMQ